MLLLFDNLGDISAEVAQLVVHDFAEVDVASSSLIFRLLPDGVAGNIKLSESLVLGS